MTLDPSQGCKNVIDSHFEDATGADDDVRRRIQ